MRMLLKFELGLDAANDAIRTGTMCRINESIAKTTRPEAAYYGTENGARTGYVFFDMQDPAQIPVIAEPLFQLANAKVEFIPVMNDDDLARAFTLIEGA